MADNTTIGAMSGGDVIATDDIGGVKWQRVKVAVGADGSATDVSSSNGMPVVGVQDSRSTGTITSAASTVGPVAVSNRNMITVDISGTYGGVTFVIEGSADGGTLYFPIQGINNATGQAGSTWTPGTNAQASYDLAVGGFTHVRVRATAWSSGTATVGITPQVFAYDPVVASLAQGLVAAGTAVTGAGNPVVQGGTDGTNVRAVLLDTAGRQVNVPAPKTYLGMTATASTAGTSGTEAMLATFVRTLNTTATSAQTVYTPTNGKKFRLCSFSIGVRAAAATATALRAVLRVSTSTTVTTSSAAVASLSCGTPAATIGSCGSNSVSFGDGPEWDGNGAISFGVSITPTWTTTAALVDVCFTGIEY